MLLKTTGPGFRRILRLAVFLALAASVVPHATAQSSESLLQRGDAALQAGQFDEAVQLLEQAYREAPQNSEIATDLLLGYVQSGRLPQAIHRRHDQMVATKAVAQAGCLSA